MWRERGVGLPPWNVATAAAVDDDESGSDLGQSAAAVEGSVGSARTQKPRHHRYTVVYNTTPTYAE